MLSSFSQTQRSKNTEIKKIEKEAVEPQTTGNDNQVRTEQKKLHNDINKFNQSTGKKKEIIEKRPFSFNSNC